jgi:hypothetical protein
MRATRVLPNLSLNTMAVITGAILALYLGVIAYALLAPSKQHDPQRGQAVGCLMLAAIPALVIGILVIVGVVWDIPKLIRWPFALCVTVFGYVMLVLIAQPVVRAWKSRR